VWRVIQESCLVSFMEPGITLRLHDLVIFIQRLMMIHAVED